MNPPTRAKLLEALEELGRRFPHWRFGQLVCNIAGWADVEVWDAEDEQLLDAIRQQAEYQQAQRNGAPSVSCAPPEACGSPPARS
jgi:hypothetical protein